MLDQGMDSLSRMGGDVTHTFNYLLSQAEHI